MKESNNREKVLKNIRHALLTDKEDNPYPNLDFESPVMPELTDTLDIVFAEALIKVAGNFIYCQTKDEFASDFRALISEKQWYNIFCVEPELQQMLDGQNILFNEQEEDFLKSDAGISTCEYLIARLGSVLVSTKQTKSRRIFAYPPVHLVVAYTSQLVPDLKQALSGLKEKYHQHFPSQISLITGPSRTADIEKTLVMGAHGPKELYVFLIEDQI